MSYDMRWAPDNLIRYVIWCHMTSRMTYWGASQFHTMSTWCHVDVVWTYGILGGLTNVIWCQHDVMLVSHDMIFGRLLPLWASIGFSLVYYSFRLSPYWIRIRWWLGTTPASYVMSYDVNITSYMTFGTHSIIIGHVIWRQHDIIYVFGGRIQYHKSCYISSTWHHVCFWRRWPVS